MENQEKTCEKKVQDRYWAKEYVSGNYRFMMFSQWYKDSRKRKVATKEDFIRWYDLLDNCKCKLNSCFNQEHLSIA